MTYARRKEQARQEAIDFQIECAEKSLSYGEIAIITEHFMRLGKRFGLLREFKENGII